MTLDEINQLMLELKEHVNQALEIYESEMCDSLQNTIDHINTLSYTLNQRINELKNNGGLGSADIEGAMSEINMDIDILNERLDNIITKEEIDTIITKIFDK